MKLLKYFHSLTPIEKKAYAKRAGTNPEYLRIHLIPRYKLPDRTPRKDLMLRLAEASGGAVTHDEIINHFLKNHL